MLNQILLTGTLRSRENEERNFHVDVRAESGN